jgi:hypothetical protein
MKLDIKLDPQDIEEIAQRLADIILKSFMEVESPYKPPETHPEKSPAEKIWTRPDGEWWNVKEVAKIIGISPQTLANWRFTGRGPTYQKVGKRILYPRADLLEFMNSFPKIRRRE